MINPITEMNANEFLGFYMVLILTVIIICWWKSNRSDWTADLAPPPVPADLDPYEIAYLRGGENEVTRLAIVSLTERGYLEVKSTTNEVFSGTLALLSLDDSSPQFIAQVDNGPNPEELSPLERAVFDWFAAAKETSKVFDGGELPALVASRCLHYQEKLQAAHLLTPDDVCDRIRNMALLAGVVIATFGVSRIVVGMMRDRPVGLLIVMSIVAGVVLVGLEEGFPEGARAGSQVESQPGQLGVCWEGLSESYHHHHHRNQESPGVSAMASRIPASSTRSILSIPSLPREPVSRVSSCCR